MQAYGAMRTAEDASKAKEEFLTIFYKELLKQAFKTPKFGMGEEENDSFSNVFTSDLLVEKMALELARSKAFSGIEGW
jgi:Rod binding domain-containing protein